MSESPAHNYKRLHVDFWECDTVIRANHMQAVVMVVEGKSVYGVMAKVLNKTAYMVDSAKLKVSSQLKPRSRR
jgi:IS30 family transposase